MEQLQLLQGLFCSTQKEVEQLQLLQGLFCSTQKEVEQLQLLQGLFCSTQKEVEQLQLLQRLFCSTQAEVEGRAGHTEASSDKDNDGGGQEGLMPATLHSKPVTHTEYHGTLLVPDCRQQGSDGVSSWILGF